ncbi:MAG: ion transporter [Planctomycetota bacterium]
MPSHKTLRSRVHFILEVDRLGDPLSRAVDRALVILIIANVLASILQSVEEIYDAMPLAFTVFEDLSIGVFALEYVLRVWSCVEQERYRDPVRGRLRFAGTPMMLLDLAVLVIPSALDLRPLRILRLLRLGRYSPQLRLFARVVAEKRDELFVGLFVAVVMLVACSTAMYHVECDVNDAFHSIPETMWWGVATLTTVGYGDVYPVTVAGKILGAMVAILGVGLFALPAGILASGFSEAIGRERQERRDRRLTAASGPAEGSERGSEPGSGDAPSASESGKSVAAGETTTRVQTSGTCPHCGASI